MNLFIQNRPVNILSELQSLGCQKWRKVLRISNWGKAHFVDPFYLLVPAHVCLSSSVNNTLPPALLLCPQQSAHSRELCRALPKISWFYTFISNNSIKLNFEKSGDSKNKLLNRTVDRGNLIHVFFSSERSFRNTDFFPCQVCLALCFFPCLALYLKAFQKN